MKNLDEFTKAYMTAALWSETDDSNPEQGGNPLDDNYTIEDIDSETQKEMIKDCQKFQIENADFIIEQNINIKSNFSCEARAGHDFWLTRNGHGAGFWDGDWKEPAAARLTDYSSDFGEYDLIASGKGGQVSKM